MRQASRRGKGTDVDQGLSRMRLQRFSQFFESTSGMADGVEGCQNNAEVRIQKAESKFCDSGLQFGILNSNSCILTFYTADRFQQQPILLRKDGASIQQNTTSSASGETRRSRGTKPHAKLT